MLQCRIKQALHYKPVTLNSLSSLFGSPNFFLFPIGNTLAGNSSKKGKSRGHKDGWSTADNKNLQSSSQQTPAVRRWIGK
jgi:hypothetical protein